MRQILPMAIIFFLAGPALGGDKAKSCDLPVQDCLNTMVNKLKSTGFIGVEIDEDEAKTKLIVTKAIPGTPAQEAGIQAGDELYALDGIRFMGENKEALRKVNVPGNRVTVTIKRNGAAKKIKLTLVPMPADLMAKYLGEHMMVHAKQEKKLAAKK